MSISEKVGPRQDETVPSAEGQPLHWFVEAAAISHPAAYWLLRKLADEGSVALIELAVEFGAEPRSWLAMGQLLRARYITEGREKLHLTALGLHALARYDAQHPERASA